MRSLGLGLILATTLPGVARAQDAFEIQVYDAETARRGEPGIEIHVNQHVIDAAPDETHVTFEPHYGLTSWTEVGGYFQTAATTTGDVAYAGVKLRLKVRWPERFWRDRIGLALNGEVSYVPARFEPDRWGTEVRPVVDLSCGLLYASINPIIATDLRGDLAGHPQLEPAAKVAVRPRGDLAIGAEAYAGFGPVDDLGAEHVTRLLGVVDLRGTWWDLDIGAGWQWSSSDHLVAKMIVGFHPTP